MEQFDLVAEGALLGGVDQAVKHPGLFVLRDQCVGLPAEGS
jgi:hypothetical protein